MIYSRLFFTSLVTLFTFIHTNPMIAHPDSSSENWQINVPVNPLQNLQPEHPRLLFTSKEEENLKHRMEKDPVLKHIVQCCILEAKEQLTLPKLERVLIGPRLLSVSRECLSRVMNLSFAYRITGDSIYAKAAIDNMLTVSAFQDWNPSHFLDVAEMTTALAIGYDWLYHDLSTEEKNTIRNAILEKGLKASLADPKAWWIQSDNNWNQVCHGGLTMGALAIAEDQPKLAETIIQRGLDKAPLAMHAYNPDGLYPEGPSYWFYGTAYTCLWSESLRTALGTDFGLTTAPGFMESALSIAHLHGPTGLSFNFADGKEGAVSPSLHGFFGKRFQNPTLSWLAIPFDSPTENSSSPTPRLYWIKNHPAHKKELNNRILPVLAIWHQLPENPVNIDSLPLDYWGAGKVHVATMRSAWADPQAIYIGLKGGDPQANHGHLDMGSFVLDALGERWAHDLGPDDYNLPGYWSGKPNSDGKRWNIYRLGALSHNTLIIDNQNQSHIHPSPIVAFHSSIDRAHAVVDLTGAYSGQAKKILRGIALLNRTQILIQDEIEGAKPGLDLRWAMVTSATIESIQGNSATLLKNGKRLTLTMLDSPQGHWQEISTKPANPKEHQNGNTRMLAWRTTTTEPLTLLRVQIDTETKAPPAAVEMIPCSQWSHTPKER